MVYDELLDSVPVIVVSEENKKKGEIVRRIVTKYLQKKNLTDAQLFKLCDTLNDKSLNELYYLEKLYNL